MSETIIAPTEELVEETQTEEPRTHIINPPMNLHIWQSWMDTQDIVNIARVRGIEIVALCGHRFVPRKNPEEYKACDACIEIAGLLMRSEGE